MTHPASDDCIFCRIIRGEAPAAVIHEDRQVIAFLDAFPSSKGHTLVVPKAHHPDILSLPAEDLAAAAMTAQRVARAQKRALAPDGIVLTQFNGAAAGQTVFHYHTHVVPRWQGQGLTIHGRRQADPAELTAVARQLSDALI